MTTNIWMEYILRNISSFVGVFSSDETILPKVYPSSCIVNFSSKNDVGTHFITLLFDNPNRCRYFDPLDLSFIPDNLSKFLNFYFPNKPSNKGIVYAKSINRLRNLYQNERTY